MTCIFYFVQVMATDVCVRLIISAEKTDRSGSARDRVYSSGFANP